MLIGGLVVGVLLVAAAALAQQFGHRFGRGHGDEPISAEALRARMDFAASWVYDQIEANQSQRDAIDGLLDELVPDLVAYHEEGEALREAFHAALETEDIDPAELERLQAELVDLVDRASSRGVEVIVQLDEVLTDAQREQLLALHR
jgi:Spy/CpxP family protein refolding chaperone